MKLSELFQELDKIRGEEDRKNHICINITNGIEALPILDGNASVMFTNIQSTHLEQKQFNTIMNRLGADFLMKLALGHRMYVVDFGTHKEIPRSLYTGVPFIKYALERAWYDKIPTKVFITPRSSKARAINVARDFYNYYNKLTKSTLRYLKKFRPYASHCPVDSDREVKLVGISASTSHDGDSELYIQLVTNWEHANENLQNELKMLRDWDV